MTAIRTMIVLAVAFALSLVPAAAPGNAQDISSHVEVPDEGPLQAIMPALLSAIEAWLTSNFDLAAAPAPPHIAIVPEKLMAAFRNQALLQGHAHSDAVLVSGSRGVVAFYHDMTRTIHLPAGWIGATPAEMSVLVHEMVHHLQNMAGLRYACPQEREALAFAAQERWLGLLGTSLAREFGLTPMSVLVKTRCMF